MNDEENFKIVFNNAFIITKYNISTGRGGENIAAGMELNTVEIVFAMHGNGAYELVMNL